MKRKTPFPIKVKFSHTQTQTSISSLCSDLLACLAADAASVADGAVAVKWPILRPGFAGLWKRELGWSDYSFKQVRILRAPTGLFSGKQEIGGTLMLSESGDEYTSDEHMIVYSIDGVPGTPACINSVGTRYLVD